MDSSIATRLDKLSNRPTKNAAADLQADLQDITEPLDEVGNNITDLVEQIDSWIDEDADREMKADARELIETLASDLAGNIRELLTRLA